MNPDGSIYFDFDGHIHAEGLDLDTSTDAIPPDDSKIRWIKNSDGSVTAELSDYSTDANSSVAQWSALSPGGGNGRAYLVLEGRKAGGISRVSAVAQNSLGNTESRIVIDSNGDSDFAPAKLGAQAGDIVFNALIRGRTGWQVCDGAGCQSGTDLYTLLGAAGHPYGTTGGGDPRVPDMRRRVPMHRDNNTVPFRNMYGTGGADTVTLTQAQIPKTWEAAPNGASFQALTTGSGTAIAATPHENLQPYITFYAQICLYDNDIV